MAAWIFVGLSPLPIIASWLGYRIMNNPWTDRLWDFASFGGLLFALVGLIFGLAAARDKLVGSLALAGGGVAFMTALVTFGMGFEIMVPTTADHTGPGTCENRDVIVGLQPDQSLESKNVVFLVTSKGESLWEDEGNRYGWGEIVGRTGTTRIGATWNVTAGMAKVVVLSAREALPGGPWSEFSFVYGIESQHTRLRCVIDGDGLPST